MAERTFKTLMRRLSKAGFDKDFVHRAVLPDWWTEECAGDPSLLPDVEFRVAKFLNAQLDKVRQPKLPLSAPTYSGAQFRHSASIERARLDATVHAAVRVAEAVVRNLRDPSPSQSLSSALSWRRELLVKTPYPDLNATAGDLWAKGIPVVHVEECPSPRFQGMAVLVQGRPVILIGHGHDIPAWLLFTIAHEAGHIEHGDCGELTPVIDATEEADPADIERLADEFAFMFLDGRVTPFAIRGRTHKELAESALKVERERGVDAAHLLFAWARGNKDPNAFMIATLAIKALWKRGSQGKRILRRHFDANVDIDSASETDRAVLSCVHLNLEPDESAPRQ